MRRLLIGVFWFLLAALVVVAFVDEFDDARPLRAPAPESVTDQERTESINQLLDEWGLTQADSQRRRAVEELGLTTQERMAIYRRLVNAEDRGQAEADRVFPTENAVTTADFTRHFELVDQLQERYRQELADELGITRDQLRGIGNEGARQNWPMPAPPR